MHASALVQYSFSDCAACHHVHHDCSPRPHRGPSRHHICDSANFFVINMHRHCQWPVHMKGAVMPVSGPEAPTGQFACICQHMFLGVVTVVLPATAHIHINLYETDRLAYLSCASPAVAVGLSPECVREKSSLP